jgi:succinylarginine dihydrolase
MWTANACTTSPSADTFDHKVHFTAANLSNKFHRSIESPTTSKILKAIFSDTQYFSHHSPLPLGEHFGDEGAANHTRFCRSYADEGVELFVFGKYGFDSRQPCPQKYPARQTFEASQAIARLHQLLPSKTVFAQQNPKVIDAGVFHNDVIAVGNKNCLFFHENAFLNTQKICDDLQKAYGKQALHYIQVLESEISTYDAIHTYLFNSQLVSLDEKNMALIAPSECQENEKVYAYLNALIQADNPINQLAIHDVKQSMKNGGGPACLRQRIVLSQEEIEASNTAVYMNDVLYSRLKVWINQHYRDVLSEYDLSDPQLLMESRTALDELTSILQLGSVYPFQQ